MMKAAIGRQNIPVIKLHVAGMKNDQTAKNLLKFIYLFFTVR